MKLLSFVSEECISSGLLGYAAQVHKQWLAKRVVTAPDVMQKAGDDVGEEPAYPYRASTITELVLL